MSEKKKWNVTSAVVTGLSHLAENTPCQDKVLVSPIQNGVNCYAAALADGVGSLQNSHIAAKIATDAALAWMNACRDRIFAEEQSNEKERLRLNALAAQMLEKIRQEIREQAELQGMDVRSMDCNLAFCFVDEDQEKAFVGQLGDCAVCIVCDDSDRSRSRVLNQQGLMANSTDTVMCKGSENRVNLCIVPLAQKGPKGNRLLYGFVLTSDGLENVLYRKGSKYVCKQAEYCFNLDNTNRGESLRELLTDAQESSRGYLDDDLSVVVLSCVDGPITLPKEPYWVCRKCGAENMGMELRCHNCGAEMLSMFPREDIEKAGSAEAYFEWLNRKGGMDPAVTRNAGEVKAGRQGKKGKNKNNGKTTGTIDTTAASEEETNERTGGSWGQANLSRIGGSLKRGAVPAERGGDENGHDPNGIQKKQYRQDADAGERGSGLVTKILFVVLVSATVCMVALLVAMGVKNWIANGTTPGTEPGTVPGHSALPPDSGTEPNLPTGEGIRLEDGTVFFGELLNGSPDGWGTLIDEEKHTVYTGYFKMGMKDGVFTVTTYQDHEVVAVVVFYRDGVVMDTYYGEIEGNGRNVATVTYGVRLYAAPNYDGEPVMDASGKSIRLQAGETVYLTNEESTDANGNKWSQIETVDGIIGWCEDGAIRRIVQEGPETPEIQDGIIYPD